MSRWTNAAELSVWQGAKVEDCCGNCLECEHCASIEVDGKEIMVLCEAQDEL